MTEGKTNGSHFKAWEEEYSHVKWGGAAPIKVIRDHIPEKGRILDAGSGNGRHLLPLSNFYNCVGIDVSLKALSASKESLAKRQRQAHHVASSITDIPFRDNSFDAIICYGVLQHLLENERNIAVAEFKRILRPGGIVFLEVFGREDMRYGGKDVEPDTFVRQSGIIYHYFTKEELEELFSNFAASKLDNVVTKKIFKGESYTRHMINGIIEKASESDAKIC